MGRVKDGADGTRTGIGIRTEGTPLAAGGDRYRVLESALNFAWPNGMTPIQKA